VVDMNRSRLRVDAFRIEVSSSAFVVDSGVLRNQWATMAMPNENKAPTGRRLTKAKPVSTADRLLVLELRGLIEAAHQRVATAVNSELVLLYWRIGSQLRQEVLGGKRAQYGEVIVSTLSRQLSGRLRSRLQPTESFSHDSFCRDLAGREQSGTTGRPPGVESFQGDSLSGGSSATGFLRGDEPPGEMECPNIARTRQRHAL
jgi:hypothetical protein